MKGEKQHIPPLGYHWLTPLYDPVVRLSTREKTVKRALLRQILLMPRDRVLDLGCGTATLTIALAKQYPLASIVGLDADSLALGIARNKALRTAVRVDFEQGSSSCMPFPDAYFDSVVSSLFFHHLTPQEKLTTLSEIGRVLKPGGQLHVADWGKPANLVMHVAFLLVRLLDGFETTEDSVQGRLLEMIRAAGFANVQETGRINTPLGTITLCRASRRRGNASQPGWPNPGPAWPGLHASPSRGGVE